MHEWRPQVFLVGAGPGDPGLLTRRGAQVLARADVVFYDNLTHPDLLDLAPETAERVYVGKRVGKPRPEQLWINQRIVEEARAGRCVVRLKGGDSFVFGRGGEEALALSQAGIRYELVPGVSSAIAGPESAGIPVTHRGVTTAVTMVVGYEDPDDPGCSVDWRALGALDHTLVVLMATMHWQRILQLIQEGGRLGSTPVATISQATLPEQQSRRSTLEGAIAEFDRIELPAPALMVVGGVAGLDEAMNQFERRPLFGRRIAVTRPAQAGLSTAEAIREAGADVVAFPCIATEPLAVSPDELLARLESVRERSGWIVFPSPSAITHFFAALDQTVLDARALGGIRVAVIGKSSARRLESHGLRADFVSTGGTGADLGSTLPAEEGSIVLVCGAAQSRPELPATLKDRGVMSDHLPLYQTVDRPDEVDELVEYIVEDALDFITVHSPSAVRAILAGVERSAEPVALDQVGWIAIGPTTSAELESAGIRPAAVASQPDDTNLIDAIISVLESSRERSG